MLIAGYDTPLNLLKLELLELTESGHRIPDALRDRIEALHPVYDAYNECVESFYRELAMLTPVAEYPFVEPDEYDKIVAERPEGVSLAAVAPDEGSLSDRWLGAWSGRCAGCTLGQPVEGWTRSAIESYLRKIGDWPLTNYFSNRGMEKENEFFRSHPAVRENIAFVGADDDVNYTVLALAVMEKYGRNFDWRKIADSWNDLLSYNTICTAETQALLNYNLRRKRFVQPEEIAVTAAFTRRNNNPYREWIGAQIRADFWGYVTPGNPGLAAEFAWRDACWTHCGNGIYGAMMMAAIISAAFVTDDFDRLTAIGLAVIPRKCRLAEAVAEALEWFRECPDFESFMLKLERRYANMSITHTIVNAIIVLMALYYGKLEPEPSICIAVMAGKDTDCNAATVGSIVGAIHGLERFQGVLLKPLHGMVKPKVFGFAEITLPELAERTKKVYYRLQQQTEAEKCSAGKG